MSDADLMQQESRDRALRALAYELKQPLISIARRAELNDPQAATKIQQTAEQALMLVDSFLLSAQAEYGQTALDLTPAGLGSILYDVSVQMRPMAIDNNLDIFIEDKTHETVMTHRGALVSILRFFGMALITEDHQERQIFLRSYKTRKGKLEVGVFAKSKITSLDLKRALVLQGNAHMPLSKVNGASNVSLAIADSLCKSLGGNMKVKHMGKYSGLATELPKSEQLAFV